MISRYMLSMVSSLAFWVFFSIPFGPDSVDIVIPANIRSMIIVIMSAIKGIGFAFVL